MGEPAAEAIRRPSAGFTLLELTVALGLLMLIGSVLAGTLTPWLAFEQGQDTEQRLLAAQQVWRDWLERHAADIERDPTQPGIPVGSAWLADGSKSDSPNLRSQLGQALGSSAPELFEDGFHRPWTLRISRGLARDQRGTTLHYHVLALLSGGANGQIEPGTRFEPDTGLLVLGGDDRGIVVDTWPAAVAQLEVLEQRLQRVAAVWQDWFRARWEGDAARDASIDYFAAACPGDPLANAWDTGADALPAPCAESDDPAAPGSRLGLSTDELRDPTGAMLRFDAHSGATRNPDRTDPGQNMPPYSAMVSGTLPGGVQIQRAALGTL